MKNIDVVQIGCLYTFISPKKIIEYVGCDCPIVNHIHMHVHACILKPSHDYNSICDDYKDYTWGIKIIIIDDDYNIQLSK